MNDYRWQWSELCGLEHVLDLPSAYGTGGLSALETTVWSQFPLPAAFLELCWSSTGSQYQLRIIAGVQGELYWRTVYETPAVLTKDAALRCGVFLVQLVTTVPPKRSALLLVMLKSLNEG